MICHRPSMNIRVSRSVNALAPITHSTRESGHGSGELDRQNFVGSPLAASGGRGPLPNDWEIFFHRAVQKLAPCRRDIVGPGMKDLRQAVGVAVVQSIEIVGQHATHGRIRLVYWCLRRDLDGGRMNRADGVVQQELMHSSTRGRRLSRIRRRRAGGLGQPGDRRFRRAPGPRAAIFGSP